MQNIKLLSNDNLLTATKSLVTEERKLTFQVLEYLKEIEFRKLYLELGFPSLYEFCIKELGYSEGSAHRRIASMRLVKELPQIKDKVVSGDLSLSVLSQAQSFFKKQAKDNKPFVKEEKLELLTKLEKTSTRECEKELIKLDPELQKKDQVRVISENLTEIRITVDNEFVKNIEKLKNLLAHSHPEANTQSILKLAVLELLKKKDPTLKTKLKKSRLEQIERFQLTKPRSFAIAQDDKKNQTKNLLENFGSEAQEGPQKGSPRMANHSKTTISSASDKATHQTKTNPNINLPSAPEVLKVKPQDKRYISSCLKYEVWMRDQGCCQYMNPITKQKCKSKHRLEYDHIKPFSINGKTELNNLRLLCRSHNQYRYTKSTHSQYQPWRKQL